jgi:hypothetical protein
LNRCRIAEMTRATSTGASSGYDTAQYPGRPTTPDEGPTIHFIGGSRFATIDAKMCEAPVEYEDALRQVFDEGAGADWQAWWRSAGEKDCWIEFFVGEATEVRIRRSSKRVDVRFTRAIVESGVFVAPRHRELPHPVATNL